MEGTGVEATWWNVAKINSAAAEAMTEGDYRRYTTLMVMREQLIEQMKAEGRYDVF